MQHQIVAGHIRANRTAVKQIGIDLPAALHQLCRGNGERRPGSCVQLRVYGRVIVRSKRNHTGSTEDHVAVYAGDGGYIIVEIVDGDRTGVCKRAAGKIELIPGNHEDGTGTCNVVERGIGNLKCTRTAQFSAADRRATVDLNLRTATGKNVTR